MNRIFLLISCLTLSDSRVFNKCTNLDNPSRSLSIEAKEDSASTCDKKKITLTYTGPKNLCWEQDNSINPTWRDPCYDWYDNRTQFPNNTYVYTVNSLNIDNSYRLWHFRVMRKAGFPGSECPISFNESLFKACSTTSPSADTGTVLPSATGTVFPSETNSGKTFAAAEVSLPEYFIIVTCIVVFLVLLVALLCVGRSRYKEGIWRKVKFHEVVIVPKVSLTIFLLFLEENPIHKAVVLRFATYMKERFGFKIILEHYSREKVYENPASWLEKSLSNSDVVLVVWSPGAEERWHDPEKHTDRLDLFTPVLKGIKNKMSLHTNLSKYMFAYFEHDGNDIPEYIQNSSIPCIRLMADFYSLCHKLVESKSSNEIPSQKPKVKHEKMHNTSLQLQAVELEKKISEMNSLDKRSEAWSQSRSSRLHLARFKFC